MARLTKKMKEILATDPFFIYGRVHPSEYDWKKDFGNIAVSVNRNCLCGFYLPLDVGKVLGLASYAAELEEQIEALKCVSR